MVSSLSKGGCKNKKDFLFGKSLSLSFLHLLGLYFGFMICRGNENCVIEKEKEEEIKGVEE
jgi:hypothetical protein